MNRKELLKHIFFVFILVELFVGAVFVVVAIECYLGGFCRGYNVDFEYVIDTLEQVYTRPRLLASTYILQFFLLIPFLIMAASYLKGGWREAIGIKGFSVDILYTPSILYFSFVFSVYFLDVDFGGGEFLENSFLEFDVFFFIAVVLLAPILEELFFRGYLFSVVLSVFKSRVAVSVFVSFLFCVAHASQYDGFYYFYIFSLSILLCYVRVVSGSVFPAIIIHMFNNLVSIIYLYSLSL